MIVQPSQRRRLAVRIVLGAMLTALAPACDTTARRDKPGTTTGELVSDDPRCPAGKHRCNGERLDRCDPALGGWVEANRCQTAAHCNAMLRQCLVDPCVLGEHQCDGSMLQQCRANGWENVRDCGSPSHCDDRGGTCR